MCGIEYTLIALNMTLHWLPEHAVGSQDTQCVRAIFDVDW
jgi:hypothetical protein